MHPTEMNLAITSITNHLYCNLSREDFINLGVFLSMLSKDILSMAALEGICKYGINGGAVEEAGIAD